MLVKWEPILRQVCAVHVCVLYVGMHHCFLPQPCVSVSPGSNEISCPRECTNRASIAPGDAYQLAAPQTATACQPCRSVSQTHRLLLKRGCVLHTILSLFLKHTQLYLQGGLLWHVRPLQPTPTHTHKGYYGNAYQQPELIKPYLQPLNFLCVHSSTVGLLILGLDGHSINS